MRGDANNKMDGSCLFWQFHINNLIQRREQIIAIQRDAAFVAGSPFRSRVFHYPGSHPR